MGKRKVFSESRFHSSEIDILHLQKRRRVCLCETASGILSTAEADGASKLVGASWKDQQSSVRMVHTVTGSLANVRERRAMLESMKTATSDEQIVVQALTGDADAFGEIVRRWERRIYALAYGMLGREDDARDATQETFIAAFRNLRGFRGDAKVSSWLHRIAVNQCISHQRRAKVRGESSLEDEVERANSVSFFASADKTPARITEAREETAAVRRAVAALPTELRQVIVMKEFEELTFQQIADALDIPLSTVKSRLYTALKQLRLRLAKHANAEVASR